MLLLIWSGVASFSYWRLVKCRESTAHIRKCTCMVYVAVLPSFSKCGWTWLVAVQVGGV